MMEANPLESVRNNVLGTKVLAELAAEHGVQQFVLVSTDKAVRPKNVLGQTKAICEWVVQSAAARDGDDASFIAVRFGNVLGSSGTVIPLFRRQIARGGPVTVTHPDMERYFMTIPEAVQLTVQAGALGRSGDVFVLDMGEPVKIVDLAYNMIRLSGKEPERDIAVEFTGIRPGEKLTEDLWGEGESYHHHLAPQDPLRRVGADRPGLARRRDRRARAPRQRRRDGPARRPAGRHDPEPASADEPAAAARRRPPPQPRSLLRRPDRDERDWNISGPRQLGGPACRA